MSVPDVEYKNGRKNNWRGWQWNRIVERLTVPTRHATVLYLAGPKDLDRPCMLRRGFREQNIAAVDRDDRTIKHLRINGRSVIPMDFGNVVLESPFTPLHLVVADFCCGLGAATERLVTALLCAKSIGIAGVTVAINLQRGRDKIRDYRSLPTPDGIPSKHRGVLFWMYLWSRFFNIEQHHGLAEAEAYHLRHWDAHPRPIARSYRARRVIMDSVVFHFPLVGYQYDIVHPQRHAELIRKVAAFKAVRTRRMRA